MVNEDKYTIHGCYGYWIIAPKTDSSPLKMMISNRNLLFQGVIFMCHVSFREGILDHLIKCGPI